MHPALLVLLFYPLSAFGGLVTQLPPTTVYCGAGDFDSVNSDELGLLAVNGNVQLKNFGAGGQLPPTPFGVLHSAMNVIHIFIVCLFRVRNRSPHARV